MYVKPKNKNKKLKIKNKKQKINVLHTYETKKEKTKNEFLKAKLNSEIIEMFILKLKTKMKSKK